MHEKKISLLLITFLFYSSTFCQSLSESNSNLCNSSILRKSDVGYYTSSINPTAFHQDNEGNSLMAHYYYSNDCLGNFGGCYYSSLIKSDKSGKFLWEMSFEKNLSESYGSFYGAFINGITCDEEGNVYMAGNYGSKTINFGSGDILNETNRTYNRSFFAKLDSKNGKTVWVIHDVNYNFDFSHTGGTDLKYHKGNLYAAYIQFTNQKLKLPDDSFYYPKGKHGVLKISKAGAILDNMFIETTDDSYAPGFFNPNREANYVSRSIAIFPKIDVNKNGKIIMSGLFKDTLYFNNSKNFLKNIPRATPSYYLAIFDVDQAINKVIIPFYYKDEVGTNLHIIFKPMICLDDSNNIYQAINIKNYPYFAIPGVHLENPKDASFIIKYNSEGKYLWNSKMAGQTTVNDIKFKGGIIGVGSFNKEFKLDSWNTIAGYGFDDGFLIKLSESKSPLLFAKFGSTINDKIYYASLSSTNNSLRLFGSADHYLKYNNVKIFNESECSFVLDYPLGQECETITNMTSNVEFTNGTTIVVKDKKIELKSESFLNFKEIKLSLFDIQGRLVKSIIEHPTSATITLETGFNSGIYLLQIRRDNDNMENRKFILE